MRTLIVKNVSDDNGNKAVSYIKVDRILAVSVNDSNLFIVVEDAYLETDRTYTFTGLTHGGASFAMEEMIGFINSILDDKTGNLIVDLEDYLEKEGEIQ